MNVQSRIAAAPVMSERRVSLLGALLVAIGPVSMALYTPAMPEIVHAFGTTEAAVKLTLSVYFAGFAVAQLVCGPLSDGFGRKPVTFAFMGIYLVASLLALAAPTVELLIIARLLQGVGAAVGWSIARAVVRDLFTNERSARIMNLMGLILAVGPAFSPTLGGITMEFAGWHAVFVVMFVAAVVIMIVVHFAMVETVERDLSRIRPRALLASYREVLTTPYFVLASIVLAGAVGAIYTQATILPFILMERVGLSPSQFGAGMLMQSGFYFAGSLVVRPLLGRYGAFTLVPVGLAFVAIGAVALAVALRVQEASFLGVMGPVAFSAFGIAFVMPAMATATLAPFPHIAGAASSMSGFFQMGGGLLGGLVCAALGEPVFAMATVIPAMGLIAILAWAAWRRLPKPAAAGIVHPAPPPEAGQ
jgi:DHA1 family bicyclomycin/chloramphenicol resistance-like MFS transporter